MAQDFLLGIINHEQSLRGKWSAESESKRDNDN